LEAELADPGSLRSQVYTAYRALLEARAAEPAFDPYGEHRVLDAGEGVFALLRLAGAGGAPVLCLQNVSGRVQMVRVEYDDLGMPSGPWRDLLSAATYPGDRGALALELAPYQVFWLKGDKENRLSWARVLERKG
jgi:sucrose phosphorylase